MEHVTHGVAVLRDCPALADLVGNFNDIVFDGNSFLPLLDLKAVSLFGYHSHIRNMDVEYQSSCRVMVDLSEPGYGADLDKAMDAITSFVRDFLRPRFPEGFSLHIRAMSLLLQVPFGGECQVWHTDENEDEEGLVYSVLIPCHQQSAPVFLDKISWKCGPSGSKPLLRLGDMAFWDAMNVVHAGSSTDRVPPGSLLRAAIFVSVGSTASNSGEVQIHSGPDVEQWNECAHPIIRFCVRCRRGVQPCEPRMMYCRLCIGENLFQATAVVCQWCHDSDDHLHSDAQLISAGENKLLQAVWCGFKSDDSTLCVHGNLHFELMSLCERLLVHFDQDELCQGFTFWRDFMLNVVPDEIYFKRVHRGLTPNEPLQWKFFIWKFVEHGKKRWNCLRCYGLMRVTASLCGISSLFRHDTLPSGSLSVFVASNEMSVHAESCLAAFRVAQANADRVLLNQMNDDHIRTALLWLEGDNVTTHCSCSDRNQFNGTVRPLSFHHQVRKCPGPTLFVGVKEQSAAAEAWITKFVSVVKKRPGEDFVLLIFVRLI